MYQEANEHIKKEVYKYLWAYGRGTKARGKEGYRSYIAPGAVLSSCITYLSLHYHISSHRISSHHISSHLISSHLIISHLVVPSALSSYSATTFSQLISFIISHPILSYLILPHLIIACLS